MVGGYRPSVTGGGMASLIPGTYENGKLIYRGRVGTGFTEATRNKIKMSAVKVSSAPTDLRTLSARKGRSSMPRAIQ